MTHIERDAREPRYEEHCCVNCRVVFVPTAGFPAICPGCGIAQPVAAPAEERAPEIAHPRLGTPEGLAAHWREIASRCPVPAVADTLRGCADAMDRHLWPAEPEQPARRIEGWAKESTKGWREEEAPVVTHYFAEGATIVREFDGSEVGSDDDGYIRATLLLHEGTVAPEDGEQEETR